MKTKMAMQLDTSRSLDRRTTSRNMQVAAFAVLSSVSSKEKIFIVLQRKRVSTCADVMDGSDIVSVVFSLQECQIKYCETKAARAHARPKLTKNAW